MGDPEYQFCESSVFLPTSLYDLCLSVGEGFNGYLIFLRLAI
jgi:hypothetical protein